MDRLINENAVLSAIGEWIAHNEQTYTNATEYLRNRVKAIKTAEQEPCEDAISRAELINKTIKKNSIWLGITDSRGMNLQEIIDELPSIQPTTKENLVVGDVISRADAIKALEYELSIEADGGLDKYRTVIKDLLNAIYNTQKKAIEDLPSIQPKTDVLDKIRAEIEQYEADCRLQGGTDECEKCNSNVFGSVYRIIDKYKAEKE